MHAAKGWMDDDEEYFGSERDFGKAGQTDKRQVGEVVT